VGSSPLLNCAGSGAQTGSGPRRHSFADAGECARAGVDVGGQDGVVVKNKPRRRTGRGIDRDGARTVSCRHGLIDTVQSFGGATRDFVCLLTRMIHERLCCYCLPAGAARRQAAPRGRLATRLARFRDEPS